MVIPLYREKEYFGGMKNWIARIFVSALAVLITTYLLKGVPPGLKSGMRL